VEPVAPDPVLEPEPELLPLRDPPELEPLPVDPEPEEPEPTCAPPVESIPEPLLEEPEPMPLDEPEPMLLELPDRLDEPLELTSILVAAPPLVPGEMVAVWPDFRSVTFTWLPSTVTTVLGSTLILVSF